MCLYFGKTSLQIQVKNKSLLSANGKERMEVTFKGVSGVFCPLCKIALFFLSFILKF